MRGKDSQQPRLLSEIRITPAYAGKSLTSSKFTELTGDHPRLCGEKLQNGVLYPHILGSPPPMRGKEWEKMEIMELQRITPAYAGKSNNGYSLQYMHKDHPRLCGEKSVQMSQKIVSQGSPPPMRGKELFPVVSVRRFRITPAYAGKSHKTHSGN